MVEQAPRPRPVGTAEYARVRDDDLAQAPQ
jgi:hypothetical protein